MADKSESNSVLKLGPNLNGQILYFFGARHTNDPTDSQFDLLKKFWKDFLNNSNGERIMFIEGNTLEIPKDFEEVVRQYGESGAAKWLAIKENVDVVRTEPEDAQQRKFLCEVLDPEVVAYTVIAQNLSSWFRHSGKTSFDDSLDRVIIREAKFVDIYKFNLNKDWFLKQHNKLFNNQVLEDKSFLDKITDPRTKYSIVNSIVSERSRLRNEYILSIIKEHWGKGKNIFIIYGRGHLDSLRGQLQLL